MHKGFFITGTDTDVGKTVAAAWLVLHLQASYWKPVQCGIDSETDPQFIRRITGCEVFPPAHELTQPLSPHEAAKREGVAIEMKDFILPHTDRPLIVEGAGGLMVPLNKGSFVIDLIAQLKLPAILVVRSALGTINHTLLSLEALRARDIPIAGVIINGHKMPHNRQAIEEYGRVPVIAEIDRLKFMHAETLREIKPERKLI